jgi:hypothetical protein
MTQKTAVQWLVDEIFAGKTKEWQKEIDLALSIETDQIGKSFLAGGKSAVNMIKGRNFQTIEEYIEEKYQNETSD